MSTAISELHRSVHFHYTIIRCCVTHFPGVRPRKLICGPYDHLLFRMSDHQFTAPAQVDRLTPNSGFGSPE